jgi:hypothetical protein
MYAVGVGFVLVATSALHAGYSRAVGNQSQSGIAELRTQAAKKKATLQAQQLAEQGKLESLDLSGANTASSDERLLSADPISDGAIPAIVYADKAAAYQTAIVTALKDVSKNVALVGPGAVAAIAVIVDAAATQVPTDAATLALYTAIVAQVAGKANAAAILADVIVGNLNTAEVIAAKINQLVLEGIAADVAANNGAAPAGSAPNKAAVCIDANIAAAAFGVTYKVSNIDPTTGTWVVSRPLSFTTIKDSAGKDAKGALHFHQGDFSDTAGFFVGLDETYDYTKLTAQNKEYALSRVDLTPSEYGVVNPMVTPIAPAKVMLNAAADQANPIYGKGLTHLLINGDVDEPSVAVVAQGDSKHLYVVTDIYGGSTVLKNDAVIKDAAAGDTIQKVFDIAATRKLTKYFNAGYTAVAAGATNSVDDRQLLFAAVADNADLQAATAANTGIAVMTVEADKLTPRSAAATNGAGNQAALIDLAHAGANPILAKNAAATWAKPVAGVNQGDVNLWWDDRYKQLFGTVAGLQPGALANNNVAFGLFAGNHDADTFKLSPMQQLAQNVIKADTEANIAASIFGAAGKDAAAVTEAQINLSRPRTMHTSTNKDYLLVTGGVATKNYAASKTWVNALPLQAPDPAGAFKGLADATDLANALPVAFDKARTPHVDRIFASNAIVDEYTPFIVGRHPSFLAPVAGTANATEVKIDDKKKANVKVKARTTLAPGSVITGGAGKNEQSVLGQTEFALVHAANAGSVVLTAGTKLAPSVQIGSGVTADSALQFSTGTIFRKMSEFLADATLKQGGLEVSGANLILKPSSVLGAGSLVKQDMELAADATFGAGANTLFGVGSKLMNGSTLAQGSVINRADTANLAVPAGSVVKFDAAAANKIGMDAVTDINLVANHANGVELHKEQDWAPYTAIKALQIAADGFAGAADFPAANKFTRALLKLDNDDIDSQVAFTPIMTGNTVGQALNGIANTNANDSGKVALGNLSKILAANFAADPVLGRGLAVADAITQQAVDAAATGEKVLKAGLEKVIGDVAALPGIPDDVYTVLNSVATQAVIQAVFPVSAMKDYLGVVNAAVTVAAANDELGKFAKSVMASAVALDAGNDDEKRELFGNAVGAAYAAVATAGAGQKTLQSAWANSATKYIALPAGNENLRTDEFLAQFKTEIPAPPLVAGDLGTKLTAIYDAGKANYDASQGAATRPNVLKAMTPVAVTQFAGDPALPLMREFDAVAQVNDQNNSDMAVGAVKEYCAPAAVGPVADTAKGITYAIANANLGDRRNAFAAGIQAGLTNLKHDKKYNDRGAKVLDKVATQVVAGDAINTLPKTAVDQLAPLAPAPVPANAGAMAGRSVVSFAPQVDLTLPAGSMIGANSVLTGVLPQATWTMDSGLTLANDAYLPAFTLFKKGLNVSYNVGNLTMAAGSNAAADLGTPWGGQWTLANVALDRAETKHTGGPLILNKADDGIKIVTDRVIKANLVGDAWNQYSVTVPKDTILPAGTKFAATGLLNLSATFNTVNGGAWDGVLANLNFGTPGDATITEAVKALVAYNMPDGLTITFPAYPKAMIEDFTLPAGARIKNTGNASLSVHDKIVKAGLGGGNFLKADGTNALENMAKEESFVLPEEAKIFAGGANRYYTFPAGLTIDNDPLYTAGIISGSVSPDNKIANAYKLLVNMKLKQGYEQTFHPGTIFKQNVAIKPGVVAGADGYVVHADATSFGGTLKAGSMLAQNSAINLAATVGAAKDLVLGEDWQLNTDTVLPAGTTLHLPVAFNTKLSNDAGYDYAAVPVAGGAVDKVVDVGGTKLILDFAIPADVTVTIPKSSEIAGTIVQTNPAAQSLNADVIVNFANKGTADITKYSTLAQDSNLATGLKVVNKVDVVVGVNSEELATQNTDFGITNAGGNVSVLDDAAAKLIIGATPVESVTVGASPFTLARDFNLAAELEVAPGSALKANSKFGADTALGASLQLGPGVNQNVAIGTQIKKGSMIASATVVPNRGTLNVIDDHLQLNTPVAGDPVLKFPNNFRVDGNNTGALRGADSTLTIPPGNATILFPRGATWTLANTDKVTLGANTKATLKQDATIGLGSSFAANSNTVTAQSPFAVSATDMQVVGDTVYVGLEGDRNAANGIEAGVFKSTALFGDGGLVRGWTPWQRVGANTDATAFFGHSESTGNLVYLTSPEGKAFLDASTDSLINPATTVKLTQWGSGDDVLHENASLVSALASQFATSDNPQPGVYGLFDFDPDTLSFDTVDRRYFDPVFSMMIATGYERVSLIQTGATDAATNTFMPTKKFDKTSVFNFGADKGLAGIGTITCAEITRNVMADPVTAGTADKFNWIFVGGTNGLAVLVDEKGVGLSNAMTDTDGKPVYITGLDALDEKAFPTRAHTFVQLKNGNEPITNVRKIVADQATGYVYVVTKTQVLRIKPDAAAFGAGKGVLTAGAFNAAGNICPIADVTNSSYTPQGFPLLKDKAIGGGDAEFTDLVILKSSIAANKPVTLLLATTAGLVKSNDTIINDTFAGDSTALKNNTIWTSFPCKYGGTDIAINARDHTDVAKQNATVGAALRIIPANLHSGGRLMAAGDTVTFEGNLQVLATNEDGSQLRVYRLNASDGKVKGVQEATNKDTANKIFPYFAKLGDMDPDTLKNLDDNVFVLAMNSETFASGQPALISAAMVDEAIIAAAAGASELNLGGEYADVLLLPQMMTVSDSASGAVYVPANSGVMVNE